MNNDEPRAHSGELSLKSGAFSHQGVIPAKYTCDGENVSPPLSISGVPDETQSLALIVDDPDIPQVFKESRGIDSFDHWVVYGIDPATVEINENEAPGKEGLNGVGKEGYTGPCPPPEYEPTTHRYIFKLYALSGPLEFAAPPGKAEVLSAIEGTVLAEAELIGIYDRTGN